MPPKGGMVIDLMLGSKKKGPDVGLDAKAAALKEFFQAGDAGDYEAAAHAFKKAYDICSGESESSSEDAAEGDEYKE